MKPSVAALLVVAAMSASLFLGGGVALAHPVGSADEPNCHGQRVSHGASRSKVHEGHGELEFGGGTPPHRRDIIEGFLGVEITVGEWHQHIKLCLPPEPPQ